MISPLGCGNVSERIHPANVVGSFPGSIERKTNVSRPPVFRMESCLQLLRYGYSRVQQRGETTAQEFRYTMRRAGYRALQRDSGGGVPISRAGRHALREDEAFGRVASLPSLSRDFTDRSRTSEGFSILTTPFRQWKRSRKDSGLEFHPPHVASGPTSRV